VETGTGAPSKQTGSKLSVVDSYEQKYMQGGSDSRTCKLFGFTHE
jgi:hypothetical protein